MVKKTFLMFITSYMLVLCIPLILGSVVYVNAVRIAEEESNASTMAMLRQVQEVMDSRLREINQMIYQVLSNERVNQFLGAEQPLDSQKRYQAIQIIGELGAYRNFNSVADDFYIYYHRADTIVTPNSIYSPELFFENAHKFQDYDYRQWCRELSTKRFYRYFMTNHKGFVTPSGAYDISCLQSIPVNTINQPEATLVILMNKSKIASLIRNVEAANKGRVYVIDESDQVIATSYSDVPESVSYHELSGSQGLIHTKTGNGKMVVSYISSQEVRWKYVSMIPVEIFLEKSNYIKTLTLKVFLSCFFIGLAAAFVLAYRNYAPIGHLVNIVSRQFNVVPKKMHNEMEYITESVIHILDKNEELVQTEEKMLNENKHIVEVWNEQRRIILNSLLCRLVMDPYKGYDLILESLESNGVSLEGELFSIVIYGLKSGNLPAAVMEMKGDDPVVKLVEDQMRRRIPGQAYAARTDDGKIISIVNLPREAIGEEKPDDIILAASVKTIEAIEESWEVCVSAGVGRFHDGIENIQLSYREALKALEYRLVREEPVICYSRIIEKTEYYYYPIESELKIINFIKVGEDDSAVKLFDSILYENLKVRSIPMELVRCLMLDIVSTIVKILEESHLDLTTIVGYNPVEELVRCNDIGLFREMVVRLYRDIGLHIRKNRKSHNEKLIQGIVEYVNNNYTRNDISVGSISDQFHITSTYLSHFFKEQTGQNLLDYINRLRINRCKELLAQEDWTISEIARAIGYTNDIILTRTFKKYEGIPPGKYREEHTNRRNR